MKKGYVYTIIFAFVIAAVFSTLLASANQFFKSDIEKNEKITNQLAILDSLSLPLDEDSYDKYIEPLNASDEEIYIGTDENGAIVGYSIYFEGKGLWGSITGYIGVNEDFNKLLGISFVEQNETPGLGGRIEETEFRDQFREISINMETSIQYGDGIDAITGATSSSKAVLNILNDFISDKLEKVEVKINE